MINHLRTENPNYKVINPQMDNSGMDIPDYAFERMAKCLLPIMRAYFEKEEGEAELDAWEDGDTRGFVA